jgi:O-succinylbenzoic acid--CoA ligase
MQCLRAALSGGYVVFGNPHDPREGLPENFDPHGCFVSLVPTQVRRLLDTGGAAWLRQFRAVIVGGAAADSALVARARAERLPLALSYGMTETSAMAAIMRPEEFLEGRGAGVGRPLPHVRLTIVAEDGRECHPGEAGRILIRSRSLCQGMVPGNPVDRLKGLLTNDIGWLDAGGSLHVCGRADRVIISGGLKVEPQEVEDALLASGLLRDVAVAGLPDAEWGQVVAAFYVPVAGVAEGSAFEESLRFMVRQMLAPEHAPRRWFRVDAVPRTDAGKLDTARLKALSESPVHS